MVVTPVRATDGSSRMTVAWPTLTPSTSVMAFCGPGPRRPITTPRSRTRGHMGGLAPTPLAQVPARHLDEAGSDRSVDIAARQVALRSLRHEGVVGIGDVGGG